MTKIPYWLKEFHEETEAIRKQTADIQAETENLRQQNASLRALRELNRSPEKVRQIVEASIIKPTPMADSGPKDYFQWQQERQELREAVDMLGNFIAKHSKLNSFDSSMLAMQIFVNGESSGCVSAARAARLMAEADDA